MAFSVFGIFAVLLEFIRPLLPLILAVVAIDLILLVLALRSNGLQATLRALKSALPAGIFGFVGGIVFVPWITGANHANLSGLLDWLSLLGASLGLGVLLLLLIWPPLALVKRASA